MLPACGQPVTVVLWRWGCVGGKAGRDKRGVCGVGVRPLRPGPGRRVRQARDPGAERFRLELGRCVPSTPQSTAGVGRDSTRVTAAAGGLDGGQWDGGDGGVSLRSGGGGMCCPPPVRGVCIRSGNRMANARATRALVRLRGTGGCPATRSSARLRGLTTTRTEWDGVLKVGRKPHLDTYEQEHSFQPCAWIPVSWLSCPSTCLRSNAALPPQADSPRTAPAG